MPKVGASVDAVHVFAGSGRICFDADKKIWRRGIGSLDAMVLVPIMKVNVTLTAIMGCSRLPAVCADSSFVVWFAILIACAHQCPSETIAASLPRYLVVVPPIVVLSLRLPLWSDRRRFELLKLCNRSDSVPHGTSRCR